MAEAAESTKKERIVETVQMTDGRQVEFVGTRRILKETLIDETKVTMDGELLIVSPGAVAIRMDFRNGETRTYGVPTNLLAKFAGHGAEQKFGDELAVGKDKEVTLDDMVVWADDLNDRLQKGEWRQRSEGTGDSFAGASIVILALMEASGKDGAFVKAFLQRKLDDAKTRGEKLSRKELYDSFRAPGTKVAEIIDRMEKERLAKTVKVSGDDALNELMAS